MGKKTERSQNFKKAHHSGKITTDSLLEKMNLTFSRDAEWFKRTTEKFAETKEDLDKNFYSADKKAGKIDFIKKLKNKINDYKDAQKFAERYKKIRFVERRKLERKLKQITDKIIKEENEENKKELNVEKEKIVSDVNYVKVLGIFKC